MILSSLFTRTAFSTGWAIVAPFVPFVALAALLMGAVWFLDHRGYERAERDAERRWQEQIAIAAADTRRREREIASAVNTIDKNTGERLKNLQVKRQTIVQNITQELANDPRYYNREFALSERVLHYINTARAATSSSTPGTAPFIEIPLPQLPILSDGYIGTLVMADVNAAFDLAECEAKRKGVVDIYEAARQGMK